MVAKLLSSDGDIFKNDGDDIQTMVDVSEKYKVDIKAIVLNAAISLTSTATVGGLLSFWNTVPTSQMPLVLVSVFLAQFVPKILVEYNKRYQIVKAQRKAFEAGRDFNTEQLVLKFPHNFFFLIFAGLDKATYF